MLRAAHTLLEILLVLAIIGIALAVAIPTYESMVSERRLQKSAESLELQMQEARVKAMRTGQSQVFRFEVGGSNYTVEPWLSGNDEQNAGPGAVLQGMTGEVIETSATPFQGASIADLTKNNRELEVGIVVASANTVNDTRAALAATQEGIGVGVSISSPIMFYPDGTSTTAEVVLQDDKGRRRSVQIRGLTGKTKLVALEPLGS